MAIVSATDQIWCYILLLIWIFSFRRNGYLFQFAFGATLEMRIQLRQIFPNLLQIDIVDQFWSLFRQSKVGLIKVLLICFYNYLGKKKKKKSITVSQLQSWDNYIQTASISYFPGNIQASLLSPRKTQCILVGNRCGWCRSISRVG